MLVGIGIPIVLAGVRLSLVPLTHDRAPYALVFVGIVLAALLAGWRSGLLALVVGQLLVWYLIASPDGGWALDPPRMAGLVLATFAELVSLVIISLYQREIDRAAGLRERQMQLLDRALKEIDHRTGNNYQTVLALILAQSRRTPEPGVREALLLVADRVRAIASASKKLAISAENLEEVRAGEHLRELCQEISRGLARPGIDLECNFADVSLDAEKTVCISILVNELVTNALKHAFPDDRDGLIRVSLQPSNGHLELRVEDNGIGVTKDAATRGTGLGAKLVETFTRQLHAHHAIDPANHGTRHLIRIPKAA
jgi:two-component sensor histidine kinase